MNKVEKLWVAFGATTLIAMMSAFGVGAFAGTGFGVFYIVCLLTSGYALYEIMKRIKQAKK